MTPGKVRPGRATTESPPYPPDSFVTAGVTHLLRVCDGSDPNPEPILLRCYGCYGLGGGEGGCRISIPSNRQRINPNPLLIPPKQRGTLLATETYAMIPLTMPDNPNVIL